MVQSAKCFWQYGITTTYFYLISKDKTSAKFNCALYDIYCEGIRAKDITRYYVRDRHTNQTARLFLHTCSTNHLRRFFSDHDGRRIGVA